MATFKQFVHLDDSDREMLFRTQAVMVASRMENNYRYDLYQLFAFYVEIESHLFSGMLIQYCAFENTEKLDPYLRELNIALDV